jgi:transposase
MALSIDIRSRIIAAHEAGEGGYQKIASRFKVGICSVRRLVALKRETGGVEPRQHGGGIEPKIPNNRLPDLISLVQEKPDRTAEELRSEWQKKYGIKLGRSSVIRALRRAKLSLKKNVSRR